MRLRTRAAMVLLAALLLVLPVGAGPALAAGPGAPWTWGGNAFGELGDGTLPSRTTPVQAVGLAGVVQVAGGRDRSLALRADGTVWAFGHNTYGQLGDGTTSNRTAPVTVSGLTGVSAVTAGRAYSAALVGS